jgi:hypothetical protein
MYLGGLKDNLFTTKEDLSGFVEGKSKVNLGFLGGSNEN